MKNVFTVLVLMLTYSSSVLQAQINVFDSESEFFANVDIESTESFENIEFILGNPASVDQITYTSDLSFDSFSRRIGDGAVDGTRSLGASNIVLRTLTFEGPGSLSALGFYVSPSLTGLNVYDVIATTAGGETMTAPFPFNQTSTYVGFSVVGDTIEKVEIFPRANNGTNTNQINYSFDRVSWSTIPVIPEPASLALLAVGAALAAGRRAFSPRQ